MDPQRLSSIASPCVGICSLDPETDFCMGCWRTGTEIASWFSADDENRLQIIARARKRRDAVKAAQ